MRRDEFPVFVLEDPAVKETDNVETRCEEILKSRKAECYGQIYEFDNNAFLSIPEGIPPYHWYFCIFKSDCHHRVTDREVLRDCQFLLEMVLADGCKERCTTMNATDGYEYLCSCHPKAMKVGLDGGAHKQCPAAEYYYHNINFCTLHLFSIEMILQELETRRRMIGSASNKSQEIQKEMFVSLRRLYRLYLHSFYQHYGAFVEAEKMRHMYSKFFGFVTCSGLLSEKDMKPYLSLDEMNEYVYSSFSFC